MYYLRNFLGLGLLICLIPFLTFHPVTLYTYKVSIGVGILLIWLIQRHKINSQFLIIFSASFLTFLFLSCQLWTFTRRIIIGLILIIGIILMGIIGSLDYMIIRHLKQNTK